MALINKIATITDGRGDLSFVQHPDHLPFPISRVYYLYNVPAETPRGFHAHLELQQIMIALNGSFDVILDNGTHREKIRLDRPDQGLVIDKMIWREMENFSPGAICLVLASLPYDEADYIRDYDQFLKIVGESPR
jgi:hypothetical protein